MLVQQDSFKRKKNVNLKCANVNLKCADVNLKGADNKLYGEIAQESAIR